MQPAHEASEIEGGREKANVLKQLRLHATKTDEEHGSPIRIISSANDQLDAAR